MRHVVLALVGSFLTMGLGCSGSSDGAAASLNCAWLTGDNCWKQTADEATGCLPPSTETGILSADHGSCAFPSGAVVTFTPPLVLPVPDNPTWNFTITNGGQTCLAYSDNNQGFRLTVAGKTVSESPSGAMGMSITCPDGAVYSNSNGFELLSCNSDAGLFFGGLPGNMWSGGNTGVTFSLLGASSALQLFNCHEATP